MTTGQPVLTEFERLNAKVREMQRLLSNSRRDLEEALEALRPFAGLADVCDHFKHLPGKTICSWRIRGEPFRGPTADDCRNARAIMKAMERAGAAVGGSSNG